MLKVLMLVDHAVGISGPHRNVVSSLNALSTRDDIDLRLLTGRIDAHEPFAKRCDIHLGFTPHNPRKIVSNLRLLRRAIKDRDLIYVPTGLKSFFYAFATKGRHKLVAGPNVTGIPYLMNPANPSPLMTMKMSDAWIEMSEVRVNECVGAGTPRDYISLVPHSVDTEKFNPIYRDRTVWQKEGLDPNVLKIVYTGHMDVERKGIPQLIEAFKRLRELCPDIPIDLVLIGRDGPMLTEEHRAISGVHVLGVRHGLEFVRLLASADVFMGFSRYETFWFAPIEAMSCELPVIVSNVGAVSTFIPENGSQGYGLDVVRQHRYVPDLAEQVAPVAHDLVRDKKLRNKMGALARKHVMQNFSESGLGQNLAAIFYDVTTVK